MGSAEECQPSSLEHDIIATFSKNVIWISAPMFKTQGKVGKTFAPFRQRSVVMIACVLFDWTMCGIIGSLDAFVRFSPASCQINYISPCRLDRVACLCEYVNNDVGLTINMID